MRRWLAFTATLGLLTLSGFAAQAVASRGGLDSRGGHHCWTNCARYSLYTGQYHCHRYPCGPADVSRHRKHGH